MQPSIRHELSAHHATRSGAIVLSSGEGSGTATQTAVLIIEDEPLLRMDVADMVEDAGYDATEAVDADEGLGVLDSRSDIRAVLTDIDMPGSQDGVQFANLIRARWPEIAIILISGKHRLRLEDLPPRTAFFTKPYDAEQVTSALHRMVSRR